MKTSLPFRWSLTLSLSLAVQLAGSARAQIGPGYALSLDGVNDYVSVPHNASLNAYPLTISAWVKTSRNAAVADGVISKYIDASANGYSLFLYNGRVRGYYFRNSANYVWDGSLGLDGGVIADGAWHHVAFLVDAAGGRLLVDGVVRATLPWTGIPGATTSTVGFQIGRYWTYSTAFLGQIDEVSVWNMALTTAQIQAKMHQRLTGSEANLAAYWPFERSGAYAATDESNHGNFGTLVNGATSILSGVPFAPDVATRQATMITLTSATLNGGFNPGNLVTTPFFQWGTTTNDEGGTIGGVPSGGNNAISWSYNLTGLTSNVIHHFRLVASNSFDVVAGTNQSFTTTVFDTTKPVVVSAASTASFNTVLVTFSKELDPATANVAANYTITPALAVFKASYEGGGKVITLTTASQTSGATAYTVTVHGVTDISGWEVPEGSNTAKFFSYMLTKSGLLTFSYWGNNPGTAVDDLYGDPRYPASPD
jgi:hypothetical protein